MSKERLLNVLQYYYATSTLKEVERTGWKYWNVSRDGRIESIAEHVYGVQHLAIAIFSEFDLDVDIFKVITMLSLHETEEINMGDKTPFDGISAEEKLAMGKVAVNKTLAPLKRKGMLTDIINEFNSRETPEAKFAYLCDKMECDLQVKKYSDEGRCSIETATSKVLKDERVQQQIADGAKTVADIFMDYDKCKYAGNDIFLKMLSFLKEYDTTKK